MKTNEAPEKIYLDKNNKTLLDILSVKDTERIEYTRTDAFIKKAENYLRNKCQRFILTEKDIEDFIKIMKEE